MKRRRGRSQITCAYCETKFRSKDEWVKHIPCPEASFGKDKENAMLIAD